MSNTDTSGRAQILQAIRSALRDVPETERPDDVAVTRHYQTAPDAADSVALFTERVRDYRATVTQVPADNIAQTVAARLEATGARRVVVPRAVPPSWRPEGVEWLVDDGELPARELAGADAVLTGCAAAIAETGTFILDGHGRCGRRAVSLLPDIHVCVVEVEQIVDTVPAAIAHVEPTHPLTFVSGPSATSDIELSRVEGVHGPRTLEVILAGG